MINSDNIGYKIVNIKRLNKKNEKKKHKSEINK